MLGFTILSVSALVCLTVAAPIVNTRDVNSVSAKRQVHGLAEECEIAVAAEEGTTPYDLPSDFPTGYKSKRQYDLVGTAAECNEAIAEGLSLSEAEYDAENPTGY